MDDLKELRKSLPPDDKVPTLAQWLAGEPQRQDLAKEIQDILRLQPFMSEQSDAIAAYEALLLSLGKNDIAAANAIMREQHWKGNSLRDPDTTNWHKDAPLIFYGCWGNGRFIVLLEYHMLLFLMEQDPASILSSTPSGGSMLHATLHGSPLPVVIKELLSHGVNPYRKDKEGKTYLDRMRAALTEPLYQRQPMHYQSDHCLIISMVEKFMAEHSEVECAQQEARLIEEARAQDARRRIHGTSHGFLNR